MEDGVNDQNQTGAASSLPIPSDGRRQLALPLSPARALSLDLGSPGAAGDDEEGVDLLNYWRILVKRKWWVLGTLAVVLTMTFVNTSLETPIYRAAASVRVDMDKLQVVQVEGMPTIQGENSSDFYATQREILQSRALAERVVNEMGLTDPSQVPSSERPSLWRTLRSFLGSPSGNAARSAAKVATTNDKRGAVAAFRSGVGVQPVGTSALMLVQYDSPSPDFAIRAANALADGYTAGNLEYGFQSSAYAKSYLEDRLQELKLKLEDSERALVAVAQKEQILGSSGGANDATTLTQQNMNSVNNDASLARSARIHAEARWRQASASAGVSLPADVLESSGIRSLQESRSKLMAEYQDKLRLFKPAYPTMMQLKGQIDELDRQIATETNNIRASIRAEYDAALNQEKMLSAELDGMKADFLDQQRRSIQYNFLKREVDTNRQLYDGLLQRYKEVGLAGGLTSNNVSIVDRADSSYQIRPNLRQAMVQALFIGAMLGVILAFLFEYLDDTIKHPEDLEKKSGLAVLGLIPKLKIPMTPVSAREDPRSAFSEAYRSVRTALQFATAEGTPRSLLISSALPGEGKSTAALMLARNFAEMGKRVLLIDADLRNPSLHRQFNLEPGPGLSSFLAGAVKAADVVQATGYLQLSFISCGPLPPNPAELLAGRKMISLLTVGVEKYDQIIVDGPPVMGLADAAILGNICGGTLLIVEAGETRVEVMRHSIKRLLAARSRVIGALLNGYSPVQGRGYSYGYSYYSYNEHVSKAKPKLLRS